MNKSELMKLAKEDPKVASAILELVKQAAPGDSQTPTQFNETVPAATEGAGAAPVAPEAPAAVDPNAPPPVEGDPAAIPAEAPVIQTT